jgi:hypothetical protein
MDFKFNDTQKREIGDYTAQPAPCLFSEERARLMRSSVDEERPLCKWLQRQAGGWSVQTSPRVSLKVWNLLYNFKFEEDCLINMSIERVAGPDGGRITGLIRVRAKTEGMALCIGDKCKAIK